MLLLQRLIRLNATWMQCRSRPTCSSVEWQRLTCCQELLNSTLETKNHQAHSRTRKPPMMTCVDGKGQRVKQDLLSKHTVPTPSSIEIQQFRCLSISPDNILTWWESQQQTYPTLSKLARVVLAIPATSAPSERIFSVAGLTVNARRSSLTPSAVDKVISVHENVLINE